MYIDFVGLMNTITWFIASIVSIMVVSRGVEFGRAFMRGVFRNRALWITALGMVTFIQAVPGFILPIHDFTIGGVAFFEVSWFMLFLTYLAFVDSTIMVALQLDFFHRDTLHWKQARFVVYLVLGLLVALILLVALGTISNPSISPAVIIPLFVSTFVVVPYSGVALFIGARRTQDRNLKRHLILLAIVFVLYISHFVESSRFSNNPTLSSSFLDDFLVLAGVYVLYRAVMTLSLIGKVEEDSVTVSSKKKKGKRRVVMILAIVIVALLALVAYTQASSPPATGPWIGSTEYPLQAGGIYGVFGQSCLDDSGYIYCVGGADSSFNSSSRVYSSTSSASGVGAWASSPNQYPKSVGAQSCVANSGFLYCVGGTYDNAGDDTAISYFASISSGMIGSWTPTTSFPIPVDSQACVTSAGYIYCLGGTNETAGTNATSDLANSAWYASLSPAGIGPWIGTSSYPQGAFLPSCTASDGYVYCVGGVARGPGLHGGVNYFALSNTQNGVYFASLSANGIGKWTQTTNYPIKVAAPSCLASSGYLYCVGGEQSGGTTVNRVYSAKVTSSGVGPWHQASDYPAGIITTCVGSGGFISCLGGFESDTCLASISNLYCLDGNEGTFLVSSSIYLVPLSVLTPNSG